MKEYVVVLAQKASSEEFELLLILKDKPAWQKGKLNLLGGKIEEHEVPEEAAARELFEESGLMPVIGFYPELCGRIVGEDWVVFCCVTKVDDKPLSPRPEETELVNWFKWSDAFEDPRLIQNLKVIIPLLYAKSRGWTLTVEEPTVREYFGVKHNFKLEFENNVWSNLEYDIRTQK